MKFLISILVAVTFAVIAATAGAEEPDQPLTAAEVQAIVDAMPGGTAQRMCAYLTSNGVAPSQVVKQSRVVETSTASSRSGGHWRYVWARDRGVIDNSAPPLFFDLLPGQTPDPLPLGSPIYVEYVGGLSTSVQVETTKTFWWFVGDAAVAFDDARMSRLFRNTAACQLGPQS